ncbi:DUF6286 domain-containing protein [Actinomadura alba]|uniref:DUF6286 domain-containing protein n=1 Tax=Actinomadura alba TaxID=406431 RepID=A0ABR7LMC5_9ACTN|nr:DUF6286 domain-containing protein [Actinomadura alba]MBC6466006.1 hypothetical protein [Actinomadura alba]
MSETQFTDLLENPVSPRAARRAALREFRSRRVLAALCAAGLLTAVGALAALEVISRLVGRPTHETTVARGSALLRDLSWNDPQVLLATGALTAAGAALLLLGTLPGRTGMEPLRGTDPQLAAAITRTGLRRSLTAAALGVPGIARVTVRLRGRFRRRVVVHATTEYRNPGNLADLVGTAVAVRLDEIDPIRWRRVAVRLKWRQD